MPDNAPKKAIQAVPGEGSGIEPPRRQFTLARLQDLYNRNLFLQAFRETSDYWAPGTCLDDLSTDELVLALRLSARLGGSRVSRWLARILKKRDGDNPLVRYYTSHIKYKGWRLFDDFRAMETNPELTGANAETQASWLAYSGLWWAHLRDFDRAYDCIAKARSWKEEKAWVLSCESDIFGMQDRTVQALDSAELAWEIAPGTPYAARSLAGSLLNLGRVEEAAERLDEASKHTESYELPMLACWYLCALAETCTGEEQRRVLQRATERADQMAPLAPLADRETLAQFARVRLDIAQLADDHAGMECWAEEARSPFHRKVLESIRRNPGGARIRLPFLHAVQKHNECLPTSIASATEAMGIPIDADAMAAQITFGGTHEWAAAEWLEKRGLQVRFFVATRDVSARLIKAGFAFVITLEYDAGAHAVAVVGLDEATGTFIVHDPQSYRSSEYLLDALGKGEAPLGPMAMVILPPERAILLDQLLPKADVDSMTARQDRRRIATLYGPAQAREVVAALMSRHPSHPVARLLQAVQNHEDGQVGSALVQFQNLLKEFPGSAFVRSNLIACCRSFGNTAMLRGTLAEVVEQGILPGIQSQQEWTYPPPVYVTEYADLLRWSESTRDESRNMLHSLIQRASSFASAWHVLGDLLWNERDTAGALLGYRIAASLADTNEHYADAYCNALGRVDREEEGLEWLAKRVRRFGSSSYAIPTWVTWISALEHWGHPERALAAAQQSLDQHSDSSELLVFLVPFFARMGKWADAEERLAHLKQTGNTALFHQASVACHRMRGELTSALESAEAWLGETPLSMQARQQLLDILARRDGAPAAIARARQWVVDHPSHDEIEELYCRQWDRISYASWHKYSLLLRRVKRNPEDGWAWRELAFVAIYDFEMAGEKRQKKLVSRIIHFLDRCAAIAPGDPSTLRVQAQWCEARAEWPQAVDLWLQAIESEPSGIYAYRHAWDCASRLDQEQRLAVWTRIEAALLSEPGHSPVAGEILTLVAARFGVTMAEEAASRWSKIRHDDPEIVEAHVNLLITHGRGRTDCERALDLVSSGLQRFPFQAGLRFAQASALRKLGRFQEAEEVLSEIIRRHPDDSSARIQLAWVNHSHGRTEEALGDLAAAAARNPQNLGFPQAQVEILIETNRLQGAREMILRLTHQFPAEVGWRETAIRLLRNCGDDEGAVQTARDGVIAHPRGAYLWTLLGRTLYEARRFAAQGEIESCLRRGLAFNESLSQAADYLAMLLVEQRRYEDAEAVLLALDKRLTDPSSIRGRMAWIHRQQGKKREATEEMIAAVRQAPWYEWGWSVLLDWILEDKSWNDARSLLTQAPPEQRTNTRFQQQRLEALEQAGLPANQLDGEWNGLLYDFPEDLSLHLLRYDSLRDNERRAEAAEVLERIQAVHPDSLYVLARRVEVSAHAQKKEQAVADLLKIFFAETDPSWPTDFAWGTLKKYQYAEEGYQQVRRQLGGEKPPTERALSILSAHAMERCGIAKRGPRPLLRTVIPGPGARDVLRLLKAVKQGPRASEARLSGLLKTLCDFGYHRTVVAYWGANKKAVEADIEAWSQTARALTALRRRRAMRAFVARWRDREGLSMWVIANYIVCCPGMRSHQLKEVRSTCRDALAGLPHDHCARYLAFRLAEACALLGDQDGFRETWKQYRAYFDGKLENDEFFEVKRRYLLADIPVMARLLENNERPLFRKKIWSLRWERLTLRNPGSKQGVNLRWWWLVFVLLWILIQILRNMSNGN
jgi:predicted Zn-dependent protease